MTALRSPRPRRWRTLVISLGCALAMGACSDRKVEPDISDDVAQACTSQCAVAHACGTDDFHATADACTTACVEAETWDVLNQCTSNDLRLTYCFGTLTCEQIAEYKTWVAEGGQLSQSFPCTQELDDYYECDPEQPFEALD